MIDKPKLYKCYKATCNRCIEGQFYTEEDLKRNPENNKIICPEREYDSEYDCGMKEVDPKDLPNPPIDWKKIILIASVLLGVAIIATAIVLFIGGGNKANNGKEVVKANPTVTSPIKSAPTVKAEEPKVEPKVEPKAEPKVKEPTKPPPPPPAGKQTKNFPGGSKYVGEMKNGKMDGLGTFYYGQRELISTKDLKKRYAESGDYLIGEFYEGNVVSGKLYDSKNNIKGVIMIGR